MSPFSTGSGNASRSARLTGPNGGASATAPGADATPATDPRQLRLVAGRNGGPTLSLTLVLAGIPRPDETHVGARIGMGLLTIGVTVEKAPSTLNGSAPTPFGRSVVLELLDGASVVSSTIVSGPTSRLGFSMSLNAEQARDVLGAIDRKPSRLQLRATIEANGLRTVCETRLDELLGGCLDGLDRDAHIKLVSLAATDGDGGATVAPTPKRRVAPPRARTEESQRQARFAAIAGGRLTAVSTLLMPVEGVTAAHLQNAGALHRAGLETVGIALDDAVVIPEAEAAESLPVVRDPAASAFLDRLDPTIAWVAPSFEVVQPAPTDTAATSPFTFSFRRAGATAAGQPAIDAVTTLTLRAVTPPLADGAVVALGATETKQLPTDGLTVTFALPFRDDSGTTQVERFPGEVTPTAGGLVVRLALVDAWARLLYGALSQPGFQSLPLRVEVSWTYPGYEVIDGSALDVVFGTKVAVLPVAFTKRDARSLRNGFLEAGTATFRSPAADLVLHAQTGAKIIPTAVSVVALRPELAVTAGWWRKTSYARRTFARSQSVEVLMPCRDVGACYVEERDEGPTAIGCQDALRLGQTSWRQYEEIAVLRCPRYRVYRSLQQPGRFLALPAQYLTGRAAPTADRAYKPLLLLYAALDADRPDASRVVIDGRLQPDLTAAEIALLRSRLGGYASEPTLVFPTEIDCSAGFTWTLADVDGLDIAAVPQPDGIAVSLSADLTHALVLRDLIRHTGVAGSVAFSLPDGTTLTSSLLVALGSLTGPLAAGPTTIALEGDHATLTNEIERPLGLTELLVDTGGETLERVPVEATLSPGASLAVEVPAHTKEVWLDYTEPPAPAPTLEEIRAFVEDIETNVVFVDLVDHAALSFTSFDLEVRLKGIGSARHVSFAGAPPVASVMFALPLTTFLSQRVVQYRATVGKDDGSRVTGDWIDWDLTNRGALVALTSEALGLPTA